MALFGKSPQKAVKAEVLVVEGLDVFYGRAHALQSVSLKLDKGVLGIVGRNGMGKTTLCNAVTGMVPASGSIKFLGEEILGLAPNQITRRGIAYVPQGRRVWPSLTVDETLRLVAPKRRDVDRVYAMFPRLAERKGNGGAQLSGGEQQMLAIGRALLLEPRLLVMDEPTEGLAPVIVDQVAEALRELAAEGEISILLIEQNLGVALAVADQIAVMVNGRIANRMPAAELAADKALQEQLLGVRSSDESLVAEAPETSQPTEADGATTSPTVFTVSRAYGDAKPSLDSPSSQSVLGFNRWNVGDVHAKIGEISRASASESTTTSTSSNAVLPSAKTAKVVEFPVALSTGRAAYVVGTFDTKSKELFFIRQCIEKLGLRVITVDLATSGRASPASVHPREVARYHPSGESAVFTGDRGSAVAGMMVAFEHFIKTRRDLGGIISAGGSGGTSLATAGMRGLPVGLPKVMVSTVASSDTRPYVGPSDICMMYSVTDVQGINRISEKVLSNAAHALAGMIAHPSVESESSKASIGLTMFGVTTPCVQAVAKRLEERFDCLVFHATGVGGQSMEKLVESRLLAGVIDVSTTEIADEIGGGIFSAGANRMDVFASSSVPYVGSCGALDMVNFGAFETVPERFKGRRLYRHNPNVTLMRTTVEENRLMGEFIARKLNAMTGPVRFLIPEGGVSAIDKPGSPFWDPDADKMLFTTIEKLFRPGPMRRLVRVPLHINDEAFADALVAAWNEIHNQSTNSNESQKYAPIR